MSIIYRGMNRSELDAAYNNTEAVPDSAEKMTRFKALSTTLYETSKVQRDICYGQRPRERFDWFSCGKPGAPVFIFIHGGYWQHTSKEDFAFIANGPLQRGFDVVIAEYTLAPDATMTQIVSEIGTLLDYLSAQTHEFSLAGRTVCLSGHSAGGHLTAMHRSHRSVTHAMTISALVDLEPIRLSWLNDKLNLTQHEVDVFSPLNHISPGAPTIVAVGGNELPELVRQSTEYATACRAVGEKADLIHVPGCTHFSMLEDLASPSGLMMTTLVAALG